MHSVIGRRKALIIIVIVIGLSLIFEFHGMAFCFKQVMNSDSVNVVRDNSYEKNSVIRPSRILTSGNQEISFLSSEDSLKGVSRADLDVGIEYIWDIEDELLFKDHLPGFDVHLNVTVRNYGKEDITTPFLITCNISDDGYPQYVNYSEKIFPSCIGLTVMKAETSYNVSWNWTPPKPEDMPPGSKNDYSKNDVEFVATFKTALDGDTTPGNDKKSKEIIVIKPPYRINVKRGWYVENGSKWEWIDREPYKFVYIKGALNYFELKFTIKNLGEPTFINYLVFPPPDWIVITPTRQFWLARSNSYDPPKNLTITVFPSTNLKYLPFGIDLIISLKATCESYPDIYDTTNFIVRVDYIPNPVIVKPTPLEGENRLLITPGIGFLNTTLYNLGNGPDNFEIRAHVGRFESETNNLQTKGWNALVHTGTYSRVLNCGDDWNITLKLIVPVTETFYTQCPIVITATSLKYPDHPDGMKNVTFFIFSDILKDIKFIEPMPEEIQMLPNSEFSTQLYIRNTGNIKDKAIRFNVSQKPDDNWSVSIDTSDMPQDGLYRNSVGVINVIIKTPKFVLEYDYKILITVLSDNIPMDDLTITVQVLRILDTFLSCDTKCKSGNVSEQVIYPVSIKNIGNANDTVDLDYELMTPTMKQQNWMVKLSKKRVTLLPLESRELKLLVSIPEDAMADTDFSTPTKEGYKIVFRATSQNDTSNIAEQELEILVNPFYDLNLSKEWDKKILIYKDEKGSNDYSFKLTNMGNDIDWYNINCDTKHDWLIVPFSQRRISPMVTEILYITFDSPAEIPAGEYEFIIQCGSGNNPKLIRELFLTVDILVFDIALTEILMSNMAYKEVVVREGELVELKIKVENIGELDFSSDIFGKPLVVVLTEGSNYIGEANITFLPSKINSQNYSSWLSIFWKVGKLKTYQLLIEADPNKDLPDSNRDNNRLIFTKDVEPKTQSKSKEKEISTNILLITLILIIIVIILIIIWLRIYSTRSKKKGLDIKEKYKPYETVEKTDFSKDHEKDFEEEPEGGILAKAGERSKLQEDREKFLSERLSMVQMKPVGTMKPVKMMKPIPTSKPIIDKGKLQN